MGKGFLKHFHLGGKAKQNYLQKIKNGDKQNKYSSMPGKRNCHLRVGSERGEGSAIILREGLF